MHTLPKDILLDMLRNNLMRLLLPLLYQFSTSRLGSRRFRRFLLLVNDGCARGFWNECWFALEEDFRRGVSVRGGRGAIVLGFFLGFFT